MMDTAPATPERPGEPDNTHPTFNPLDYARPGFAEQYDAIRPRPPVALADLLCQYARAERPRLIVDLGCGTGHSLDIWLDRADMIVGVEMQPAMLALARQRLTAPNVDLRQGSAQATGLPNASVDVATCVQSFHWMEPEVTLAEVARILRPGGVFAAADYDMPAMDWEAELADLRFIETTRRMLREHGSERGVRGGQEWPKDGHLESLRRSGHFRYVREVAVHGTERGSAARLVQMALEVAGAPWGTLDALYASGVTDEQLGLTEFRSIAERVIGAGCRWFISYRVRLGVKA